MDSSHDGRGLAKESASSNRSSKRDAPLAPTSPPHTKHYPSRMGYLGPGEQPYQGYVPGSGYAVYPDVYSQPHRYSRHGTLKRTGCSIFMRSLIACSCIIVTGIFIAILVVAIALNPNHPIYKINSLSVVNFNTTPTLTGEWDTIFSIENPNSKLKGHFPDFKVDIIHKYDVIAVGYKTGFDLDKHEEKQIDVKASSNVTIASVMPDQKLKLDEIVKEREIGSMMFALRISSLPSFKSSVVTAMGGVELAICDGLKVVFQNNTGTGTLDNGGNPVLCYTYVQ